MDAKGFQALVAQLGDLSTVQREALIAALKRKLPVDRHIAIDRSPEQVARPVPDDPSIPPWRAKSSPRPRADGGRKARSCVFPGL